MATRHRHALIPNRHDLATSTVAAAVGAATGWLLAAGPRRRRTEGRDVLPDDPAWHAALRSSHPPRLD